MSQPGALGRLKPPDFSHVEKHPLRALGDAAPTDVPVVIGTHWYTDFDTPRQLPDGSWHLPSATDIKGTVRGGHCTCLAPAGAVHLLQQAWWVFYNQGQEGACDGFGHAHAQTILHDGQLFDGFWLYDEARKLEGTYPQGEGTLNRTVCEVLQKIGIREQTGEAVCVRDAPGDGPPDQKISAYRWATTAEEVCTALARSGAEAVPLLNSWGEDYPMVVWLPTDTLERLLQEEGEADVVTDQ
jgi:hypothetical protein